MVREEPVPGAEKMVEGEDPSQQRMFGSFSPLPTLARRGESAGVGQRYSQVLGVSKVEALILGMVQVQLLGLASDHSYV